MKRFLFLLITIASAISVNAQEARNTNTEMDVVINYSMIEKFQNAEYAEGTLNFATLTTSYSFDEIKLIYRAYQSGELDLIPKKIDLFLASVEEEGQDNAFPGRSGRNKDLYASKDF